MIIDIWVIAIILIANVFTSINGTVMFFYLRKMSKRPDRGADGSE